jgi:hypothetical protein
MAAEISAAKITSETIRRATEIAISWGNAIEEIQAWPKIHEVVVMKLPLSERARQIISKQFQDLRHSIPKRTPHYRYEKHFILDADSAAISFPGLQISRPPLIAD